MPNVTITEVNGDQPVTGIAEGIAVTIVYTDRGVTDTPVLVTSWDGYVAAFGWYRSDSYASYSVKGFFENGGKALWVIRIVGDDARNAGGADDYKVDIFKPQLTKGAGDGLLEVQSDVRGTTGALTNLTLSLSNATTDVTSASLANTYDITLSLADTSAWKKSARVCTTVLNGQAHRVLAGNAAPDANNSLVFYAETPGTAGNSLKVEVVDSGGAGGLDCSFNAAGTELTIDLDGDTPTATVVAAAVNLLAGAILCYVTGTGAGTWNAAVAQTTLAGGSADIPALVTASYGGTGLDAMVAASKTWLAGVGAVTAASDTFADTISIDGLNTIASKVVPGDKLIVFNGANKGCYTIDTVPSTTQVTVTENFAATQSNIIYAIMGTDGEYGHVTADLLSPGELGDEFSLKIEKEFGGTTLKATLSVTDGDDATRILETHTGLSPDSSAANYIETIIAADSELFTLDAFAENIKASGTASSAAGDATVTHAGATFEDDGVEEGDLFICTSATTAADVRVYEITAVTDNTHLEVSENFTGTQADVVYVIVGEDSSGSALMGLIGSSGITITFAGGVDDTPDKDDYIGSSTTNTGVYGIDTISPSVRPTKLWVPDAPIVVDSTGVDATNLVNQSMGEYCSNADRQFLRYAFDAERGLTPAQAIAAATSDGIDNKWVAEYYNWGEVNDPLTGTTKLVPLSGHMTGQAIGVAAGRFGKEGDHDAAANVIIIGVVGLENSVTDAEADLLNESNINCIRDWNGYRNMGDRVRTTVAEWKWLHKRDVAIRLNQSIFTSLRTWVNFTPNAPSTYSKISKVVDAYLRTEDRTLIPNGALLNVSNPDETPYYVDCTFETPGNDLASTKIYVKIGYSIVNTVEDVELRVGLWDGGASLTES
jgi:hypothetical protein